MSRILLVSLLATMGATALAQSVRVVIRDGNARYERNFYRDSYRDVYRDAYRDRYWRDRGGYYDDDYRYGDRYYDDGYYGERVLFRTHCAPDTLEGNVLKTDSVLQDLAASKDFSKADKFKAVVHEIAQIRNLDKKLTSYFSMLSIDASDNAEVAEFLGARRPKSRWLTSLEEKAGLTPRQADRVVSELSSALRGRLR